MTDTIGKYWNKCSDTFQDTSVFPICYRIFFYIILFGFYVKFFLTILRKMSFWKGKFWQFEKENFDSLKREILTV